MKRAAIVAAVLLSVSVLSLAQDRALISGDAEDKQDTPVSGVRLTLRNESLRIERTTTTNSDGFYFFAEVVPADGYVISAEAPGMQFAPQSVKFNVEVGETRHVLPSFLVAKQTAPVSSLLDPSPPNSVYLAERIGAGTLLSSYAMHPMQAADSLEPRPVAIRGLAGSAALKPMPLTYLRGRQSISAKRSVNNSSECHAAPIMELEMKRFPVAMERILAASLGMPCSAEVSL